jgi:hypothetical protein
VPAREREVLAGPRSGDEKLGGGALRLVGGVEDA